MSVPFKCPVCGGRGIVPGGFYTALSNTWLSNCTSEQCRQCGGRGIIWSTDATASYLSHCATPRVKEEWND